MPLSPSMYFESMGVEEALVECVLEFGVHRVNVDRVARRMGRSRASLYRFFGDWEGVVSAGYCSLIEVLEGRFPSFREEERPVAFDLWWSSVGEFFATPTGKAALALRPIAACHRGFHQLEQEELSRMRSFVAWARSPLIARIAWVLALSAACPSLDADARGRLQRTVRGMISMGSADACDDIDLSLAVPLEEISAA
jgi:AcrR family transcriptional regulator